MASAILITILPSSYFFPLKNALDSKALFILPYFQ